MKTILQILLLSIMLSNQVNSEPLGKTEIKNLTEIPFHRIDTTELQLLETSAAQLVWTSAEAFETFWSSLGQDKSPNIDFSKEYAIGVFSGFKPNPGYGIKIISINKTMNNLTVYYHESSPNLGFDYPAVLAFPLDIIVVKGTLPSSYSFIKKTKKN